MDELVFTSTGLLSSPRTKVERYDRSWSYRVSNNPQTDRFSDPYPSLSVTGRNLAVPPTGVTPPLRPLADRLPRTSRYASSPSAPLAGRTGRHFHAARKPDKSLQARLPAAPARPASAAINDSPKQADATQFPPDAHVTVCIGGECVVDNHALELEDLHHLLKLREREEGAALRMKGNLRSNEDDGLRGNLRSNEDDGMLSDNGRRERAQSFMIDGTPKVVSIKNPVRPRNELGTQPSLAFSTQRILLDKEEGLSLRSKSSPRNSFDDGGILRDSYASYSHSHGHSHSRARAESVHFVPHRDSQLHAERGRENTVSSNAFLRARTQINHEEGVSLRRPRSNEPTHKGGSHGHRCHAPMTKMHDSNAKDSSTQDDQSSIKNTSSKRVSINTYNDSTPNIFTPINSIPSSTKSSIKSPWSEPKKSSVTFEKALEASRSYSLRVFPTRSDQESGSVSLSGSESLSVGLSMGFEELRRSFDHREGAPLKSHDDPRGETPSTACAVGGVLEKRFMAHAHFDGTTLSRLDGPESHRFDQRLQLRIKEDKRHEGNVFRFCYEQRGSSDNPILLHFHYGSMPACDYDHQVQARANSSQQTLEELQKDLEDNVSLPESVGTHVHFSEINVKEGPSVQFMKLKKKILIGEKEEGEVFNSAFSVYRRHDGGVVGFHQTEKIDFAQLRHFRVTREDSPGSLALLTHNDGKLLGIFEKQKLSPSRALVHGSLAGDAPAGGAPVGGASAGSAPAGGAPAGGAPAGGAPAGGAPAGDNFQFIYNAENRVIGFTSDDAKSDHFERVRQERILKAKREESEEGEEGLAFRLMTSLQHADKLKVVEELPLNIEMIQGSI